MMKTLKGKLVLAPFSYDDLRGFKARPALCLINPDRFYRHVIVAYVTTQNINRVEQSDILLEITNPYFGNTGLTATSVIRLTHLTTIKISLIRGQLGKLSPTWQAEVNEKLKELFGL